ncbi:MAG: 16S rRNA (guanine(966)-N(2))-methyltransferase RsmD [Gammaproteobacteria bacterium]|nr:16S rRNA (guanine(966)-N(2))-methyltransferase RsmD [Gammaproteobacteria bacterium]
MKKGQVRIIAGIWRGRTLKVPDLAGLRPTPDRVRETVFNWLNQAIVGARCLDAFAGSGAFGFEALSRGASYVEMVDQAPLVIETLKAALHRFEGLATIYQARVPEELLEVKQAFDIVFIDPPYQAGLLLPTCFALEKRKMLAEGAWVYLESNSEITEDQLPKGWRLVKSQRAGEVHYYLARR